MNELHFEIIVCAHKHFFFGKSSIGIQGRKRKWERELQREREEIETVMSDGMNHYLFVWERKKGKSKKENDEDGERERGRITGRNQRGILFLWDEWSRNVKNKSVYLTLDKVSFIEREKREKEREREIRRKKQEKMLMGMEKEKMEMVLPDSVNYLSSLSLSRHQS